MTGRGLAIWRWVNDSFVFEATSKLAVIFIRFAGPCQFRGCIDSCIQLCLFLNVQDFEILLSLLAYQV